MAWTGSGSSDGNKKIRFGLATDRVYESNESSQQGPALCIYRDQVHMAWIDELTVARQTTRLCLARVVLNGRQFRGFEGKVILNDESPQPPALASVGNLLVLAWTDYDHLNIAISTDGKTFAKHKSHEENRLGPALCPHGNKLFIGWNGLFNNLLNIAIVEGSGTTITGVGNKVTLQDASPRGLAMASFKGKLFIAWQNELNERTHEGNIHLAYSADDGRTFSHRHVSNEKCWRGASLCVNKGNLSVAWNGVGDSRLNIATVQMSGNDITGLAGKRTFNDVSRLRPAIVGA